MLGFLSRERRARSRLRARTPWQVIAGYCGCICGDSQQNRSTSMNKGIWTRRTDGQHTKQWRVREEAELDPQKILEGTQVDKANVGTPCVLSITRTTFCGNEVKFVDIADRTWQIQQRQGTRAAFSPVKRLRETLLSSLLLKKKIKLLFSRKVQILAIHFNSQAQCPSHVASTVAHFARTVHVMLSRGPLVPTGNTFEKFISERILL